MNAHPTPCEVFIDGEPVVTVGRAGSPVSVMHTHVIPVTVNMTLSARWTGRMSLKKQPWEMGFGRPDEWVALRTVRKRWKYWPDNGVPDALRSASRELRGRSIQRWVMHLWECVWLYGRAGRANNTDADLLRKRARQAIAFVMTAPGEKRAELAVALIAAMRLGGWASAVSMMFGNEHPELVVDPVTQRIEWRGDASS